MMSKFKKSIKIYRLFLKTLILNIKKLQVMKIIIIKIKKLIIIKLKRFFKPFNKYLMREMLFLKDKKG